ncbi:tetratricopeptide repeat-containing glycosyltransferase family protein [Paraburkholderia sp. J76]|uniref:tetratricopeptide repeat-containing glycosyltransferase family protein n=1 Tax=Paraburkholderia sp. J76 TaxID=2805439 RepID=UPI002ABD920B|nr:tetratricopeptide repeat-containing glycosyltransferase family protein [Paraburkholderia sp. J76]
MSQSLQQQLLAAFEAHARAPDNAGLLMQICQTLVQARRDEQMLPWADKGLALDPENRGFIHARGRALRLRGQHAEAAAHWLAHRSLPWDSLFCEMRIGRDLYLSGEIRRAIEHLETALRRHPDDLSRDAQKARKWLAEALLSLGDARGFTHWLERNRGDSGNYRYAEAPMWNGQRNLRGERVLVTHQMGYGDQFLLFASVRQWRDAGAEVMLTCDHAIHDLIQASLPGCTVLGIARPLAVSAPLPSEALETIEAFAPTLQATLLHLPLLAAADSPLPQPYFAAYLRAPEAARERASTWAQTLRARERGKRLVGVFWDCAQRHGTEFGGKERCWAGLRSVPLAQIERLTTHSALAREVQFVSLHHPVAELANGTPRGAMSHYGPGIASFADTAACIEQLDAVLSVDAVAANLSAMMGKPTAVLVNPTGEWRWGETGARTPWMSAATVLRQAKMGEWHDVISGAIGWLLRG